MPASTGGRNRLAALYAGAGVAILASVVAALLFEAFNSGVHSDVMEGVIILFAAALMLYVSGWLLLRQDPRAWQDFLKHRAEEALAKETTLAVALLASVPLTAEPWRPLAEGEVLVVKNGRDLSPAKSVSLRPVHFESLAQASNAT